MTAYMNRKNLLMQVPRMRLWAILEDATTQRISATAKKWEEWNDNEEWILFAQGGTLTLTHQDSCGKTTWLAVQESHVGFGWVLRPTIEERNEWSQDRGWRELR